MAEFVEVMWQKDRLCKWVRENGACNSCPIEAVWCVHSTFDIGRTRKTEEIVMRWAKEHPEPVYPTFAEWQKENFPDGAEAIRPCAFTARTPQCVKKSCVDCYHETRIPPDVAEKLGIKPRLEDGE